jgi:hypothetical protein
LIAHHFAPREAVSTRRSAPAGRDVTCCCHTAAPLRRVALWAKAMWWGRAL